MRKLRRLLRKYRRKEKNARIHHHPRRWRHFRHLTARTVNAIHRVKLSHREGVDFFGTGPPPASLTNAGKTFAVRYLGFVGANEIAHYASFGVDTVAVFERGQEDGAKGYRRGFTHGREAREMARKLGIPKGRPIFFAFDWEVQESQLRNVLGYLQGAQEGMGALYVAGGYGGLGITEYLADHGIEWLWQTYAWSHHVWDPRAKLRQVLIDLPAARVEIDGIPVDYDKSVRADFGQWRPV